MHYYFISGASSGIGRALAVLLLERANVHVVGISRTCTIEHARYVHIHADLSDPAQVTQAIQSFTSVTYTDADSLYLINNAGVLDPIRYAGAYSEEEVQRLMQVNLIAAMQLISAILKMPNVYKSMVVLSVSSGAATKVIDGWSLYGAAKAGLDHFSMHIAKELELSGDRRTRIFSVAPGVVDTRMQQRIRETDRNSFSTLDRFLELHETNQLVDPDVVAQQYCKILDAPEDFPNVLFSVRDMA